MLFTEKKAVIFDLDGTLLNTLTDLKNSLNEALRLHGLPQRTTDEVRRFVGNGIATLVQRAIPDGRENPKYDAVLQDIRTIYAKHSLDTTAPYDGIPDMLHVLHQKGYLLAVVSNKPDAQVKSLCKNFFGDSIAAAVGQQEGVPLKPAPDPLFAAMRMLGASKKETVYVGDSDVDILTARNAGLPCISVLWGFRDQALLEACGAQIFAHAPAEMAQMF
ncbi:MAG: HAD family hydrolase [Oscillospiraceae bacterium]|nr:HAD family hydrolase [Oscillospiraceae bacterium]